MARRGPICRAALIVFICVYGAAVLSAVIGIFGLFGVEPGGLARIWIVFLGMPWTLLLGFLPRDFPVFLAQVLVVLAPVLNIWLLDRVCRKSRRHRM